MKSKSIVFALLLTLFCACSDDEKKTDDFGTIIPTDRTELEQTASANNTQPLSVSFQTQAAWTSQIVEARSTAPDWISIEPDHGDAAGNYTINITLSPNTSTAERSAVISISSDGEVMPIRITQSATDTDDEEDDNPSVPVTGSLVGYWGFPYKYWNGLQVEFQNDGYSYYNTDQEGPSFRNETKWIYDTDHEYFSDRTCILLRRSSEPVWGWWDVVQLTQNVLVYREPELTDTPVNNIGQFAGSYKYVGIMLRLTTGGYNFAGENQNSSAKALTGSWISYENPNDLEEYMEFVFNASGTGKTIYHKSDDDPDTFTYTFDTSSHKLTMTMEGENIMAGENAEAEVVLLNDDVLFLEFTGDDDEEPYYEILLRK